MDVSQDGEVSIVPATVKKNSDFQASTMDDLDELWGNRSSETIKPSKRRKMEIKDGSLRWFKQFSIFQIHNESISIFNT